MVSDLASSSAASAIKPNWTEVEEIEIGAAD
jgi:hypothetical protein